MLVFLASANAKVLLFALPDAKVPDVRYFAFWWNIGFKVFGRALQAEEFYIAKIERTRGGGGGGGGGRELQSPTISNSTGRHQPFIDIKHHDPLYYSKYIKNINDYEYREMATAIGLSALSEQWRLLTSLIKV